MFSLILAILCSAMISVIMRLAQPRVTYPTGLLAGNYLICCLVAMVLSISELPLLSLEALTLPVGLGVINGLLYLSGFALMQWNTRHNGVVLPSVFMKLGILVSITLSVVWFKETPTALQILGFLLALSAIWLINYQKGSRLSRSSWALLLMLMAAGMGDTMSKAYEVYGNPATENTFLFFTFLAALLMSLVLMGSKKERLGMKELLFGAALGIPNFLCSLFLLNALATVPAMIAFPTFSVGVILVVSAVGIAFFRERLTPRQLWGELLICVALILLNL